MSAATLDAVSVVHTYLYSGPTFFTIPVSLHPVEIVYSQEPESDYMEAAIQTAVQIHMEGPGDILVFASKEEEIESVSRKMNGLSWERSWLEKLLHCRQKQDLSISMEITSHS